MIKNLIIISILILLILRFPGSAEFNNDVEEKNTQKINNKLIVEINEYHKLNLPVESKKYDTIIFSLVGDDYLPSITEDENGYTILTYTNWDDPTIANLVIWFSDNPTEAFSWEGWKIGGMDIFNYCDTAYISGPNPEDYKGLFGTFICEDKEMIGGYRIPDISDPPECWCFYTWTTEAFLPKYACVDDNSWYEDLTNPEIIGPYHMYIYHLIFDDTYNIEDCPIGFHTGIESESGIGYFDGQSNLITAPASDPDMAILNDYFHVVWQYHNETTDANQIVWKKVFPTEEPDIEFTPYQQYIDYGSHPSIAAFEEKVFILYEVLCNNTKSIKCAYSNDGGENWNYKIIDHGQFPDVENYGDAFYVIYIDNNNLYRISTIDGKTWSPSEQINDVDDTVEALENSIEIHKGGIAWVDNSGADFDICWKPFHSWDHPPNLETYIEPGFHRFTITVDITNNGCGDAEETYWGINLKGGIILKGKNTSGVIEGISIDETRYIATDSIFGLGKISILVTTKPTNGEEENDVYNGFVFGPFMYII